MTYIHSPAKNRRSGSTMQKMPLRGGQKRNLKFDPLPGYPIERQFESREELTAYLAGDKVVCLLCGHPFRSLAPHIKRTHGMFTEDYKDRFGIPQKVGIHAADLAEVKAAQGRAQVQNIRTPESLAAALANRTGRRRMKLVPFVAKENADKFRAEAGRLTHTNFDWHLDVISRVWRFNKVKPPEGMASWSGFKKRWLHDTALRQQFLGARAKRLWEKAERRVLLPPQ